MWEIAVRLILRNRLGILITIFLITLFMGWHAQKVKLSYELAQMLPSDDPVYIDYLDFRQVFGEDGNIVFIGFEDNKIFSLDNFIKWQNLSDSLRSIRGVREVINITNLPELLRNDKTRKFTFKKIFDQKPDSQESLDSLISRVYNMPFYSGLLFNEQTGAFLTAVGLDSEILNTPERVGLIEEIQQKGRLFSEDTDIKLHYSGLPFIRTKTAKKVKQELNLFVILAMLVASIALYLFFRSVKAMIFPMIIVLISVVWALGFISLMGYEITILTGIIPPLLIIIGVENCIFLLNKYHHEFRSHGNKVKSLSRIVQRVGNSILLTNLTTAVGFATFMITGNKILVEFGIVAALNILTVFLLTITLVPIFFSYVNPPQRRHIRHLENPRIKRVLLRVIHQVSEHRSIVYAVAGISLVIGIAGMSRLYTSGNLVDDIPHRDPLYKDLRFFERNINGIMPMEIMIDTRKPGGVMRPGTLQAIDALQDELDKHPELSRPLSVTEAMKFARQAFYNGNPEMYELPHRHDRAFIHSYLPREDFGNSGVLGAMVDSAMQKTRVSVLMANIGTRDIRRIQEDLQPAINNIFDPEKYEVTLTGTSVVFLKGTDYLVKNLMTSLLFAVIIISFLIALLFRKFKMVIISLIPNIFPQILTAALMGFLGIPIKPSTILIFSIALGISVDNSIHFLAKFRQELHLRNYNIRLAVLAAISESGVSMVYTYVVLFFGFIIFTASSFGGTQAMGYLIAFTLTIALLSNLFLLPSILLSMHKRIEGKKLDD